MRKLTLPLALVTASVTAGMSFSPGYSLIGSQDFGPVIQTTAREVHLEFVAQQKGRAVANLHKEDVKIYQDDREIPELTSFYAAHDLPVQLVVLVDTSASMSQDLAAEESLATTALGRLVRPGFDPIAAVAFPTNTGSLGLQVEVSSPRTWELIASQPMSRVTALFDSIFELTRQIPTLNGKERSTRTVLLLLSDGDDNYSRRTVEEAVAAAQKVDLAIYAITAHSHEKFQWGDANLEKLTTGTGGRIFFLRNLAPAESTLLILERELRAEFTVTFRPLDNRCGFHRLRVEPADSSLQVRSRTGFYGDCP